jgi:HEAT repeat protein
MGAVSALADMKSPEASAALIKALPDVTDGNRKLALDALLRDQERCLALLNAVADRKIAVSALGQAPIEKLKNHPDPAVRKRAGEVLR